MNNSTKQSLLWDQCLLQNYQDDRHEFGVENTLQNIKTGLPFHRIDRLSPFMDILFIFCSIERFLVKNHSDFYSQQQIDIERMYNIIHSVVGMAYDQGNTFQNVLALTQFLLQISRHFSRIYNILMLPFNNNIPSQAYPDLYSAGAYYTGHLYYVPQDAAPYFNPLHDNQNDIFPFSPNFAENFQPYAQEEVVKIEERETKPRETKEIKDNESEVSQRNLGDSEDLSPQLRFKQKYGRNVNSNIFHHMFRRLLVIEDYGKVIEKILSRHNSILQLDEFMEIMNRKAEKLRTYVSLQKMTKMFKGQKYRNRIYEQTLIKERQFCKIFRILCRYYLKKNHILHVYNILKIKGDARRLHLVGSRKIVELMET